jgi:hypothetical protein
VGVSWCTNPNTKQGDLLHLGKKTHMSKPSLFERQAWMAVTFATPGGYEIPRVCWALLPQGHRDYYCIGSNFWKFYLIRTSFTLGELVSLVKVFRLLRLEWIFFGV